MRAGAQGFAQPRVGRLVPIPAGEATGMVRSCRGTITAVLSHYALQVLREGAEQALRVRVVGEEPDDVVALEGGQ